MPPSGAADDEDIDDGPLGFANHLHVRRAVMDRGGWNPPPAASASAAAAAADFVTSFSDDDGEEELDARMSRYSNTMNARYETHARSKSLMRYNEIERERSKRRQNIVRQKTTSKFSPGTIKLSMMNAGIIPLKKGKNN